MNVENIEPLLPSLTRATQLRVLKRDHGGFIDSDDVVNINMLSEGGPYFDKSAALLVLMPLYCKLPSKKDEHGARYYNRGREVRSLYDKMLVCLDVNGLPGQNIVVFLLGKGRNENFFSGCLVERDNGSAGKC